MATISKFPSKGNNTENRNMDFKQKLRLHKFKSFVVMLISVAVVAAIIISLLVTYQKQQYSKVSVIHSVDRVSIETNSYINNFGSVITYSKDGVSCIDDKGTIIWNMTYEMQNPIVKRSSEYVGVGDYNGHIINIVDKTGNITEIDTTIPIRDFSVSKEGLIAAILEDTSNSWVNLYDVKGTKIGEIKATMSKTGYPLCVSLSGEVVAVSYLHVDSDSMKSGVTFYNFGGVGENVTDKIVSSYEYVDTVVPTLEFMNNELMVAVGDNRLMYFEGSKIPKSTKDILLNENIVGVYPGSNQLCLVFYDTSGENKYRVDIYDTKGKLTGSYCYNIDFKDILVGNNVILIYNESQCIVVDSNGKEKYNDFFDEPVQFIATTNSDKKYLVVKDMKMDTVRFE